MPIRSKIEENLPKVDSKTVLDENLRIDHENTEKRLKSILIMLVFSDTFSGRVARFGGGGGERVHMDFVATVLKVLQFSLMHPLCRQRHDREQITKRKTNNCPRTEGCGNTEATTTNTKNIRNRT